MLLPWSYVPVLWLSTFTLEGFFLQSYTTICTLLQQTGKVGVNALHMNDLSEFPVTSPCVHSLVHIYAFTASGQKVRESRKLD